MTAATPINAFTVDVEDWFQVGAFEQVIGRGDWETKESRVVANTERLLALLESFDVRGTFFVLGWIAKRHGGLVREIADRGHEVACHGFSHRAIYTQSPAEFTAETRDARKLLQDLSGQPVSGYRAASFSITRESLWALDVLIESGFDYDSSIFPIRHDRYGIPDAPREPFMIRREGGELLEIPMAAVGPGPFRLPVSGGGYFRLLPYWLTRAAYRHLNGRGKPLRFICTRGKWTRASRASRPAGCRNSGITATWRRRTGGCVRCWASFVSGGWMRGRSG
jgi:polysaccharide deacetylase family protein (PEP-CTERM system associated)